MGYNEANESNAAIQITIDGSVEDFNIKTFFWKENCFELYIKNLIYQEKYIPSSFFKFLLLNCKNLSSITFRDCTIQSQFLLESLKAIPDVETLVFQKVHILNDPPENLPVEKLTGLVKALMEMINNHADQKNILLGRNGKEMYLFDKCDKTVQHII